MSQSNGDNIGTDILDESPIPPESVETNLTEITPEYLQKQIFTLQKQIFILQEQIDKLSYSEIATIDAVKSNQIKASMIRGNVKEIKLFCYFYCFIAIVLVILQGYQICGFNLHPAILSVIAGSAVVSVIGILVTIVAGLLRS